MAYFDTKKDSLEEAIKAAVKNEKMVILVFSVGSNIKWSDKNQTR